MATADINRVGARVAFAIGARSDTFRFAVDDDRFKIAEIANAIVETEAELITDFFEANHPQKVSFLAWKPDAGMVSGAAVPAHIGQIEDVQIKKTADPGYTPGVATSHTNIKLWRENHNSVFENVDYYFNLTNQILDFTGDLAQVYIGLYTPTYNNLNTDTINAVLQIDSIWEPALVNGAIIKLNKDGVPTDIIENAGVQYRAARTRILQGLSLQPEVDVAQKID